MTVTINFATVADSISKLSISGVTVKDLDEITASRLGQAALLAPIPDGFVTNIRFIDDAQTGGGLVRPMRLMYTLNYRYFHCQIGNILNFNAYSSMIINIVAILAALVNNDVNLSGAIQTELPRVSNIGPVLDPDGNAYHGCDISLDVMQFIN
jgi:hypothetical protein